MGSSNEIYRWMFLIFHFSSLYLSSYLWIYCRHPFDSSKWGRICRFLIAEGLLDKKHIVEPVEAKWEDLLVVFILAHTVHIWLSSTYGVYDICLDDVGRNDFICGFTWIFYVLRKFNISISLLTADWNSCWPRAVNSKFSHLIFGR